MADRIVLANLAFQARHGVHDWEKRQPQRFEIDVELWLDLVPAGRSDDLAQTVDYGAAAAVVRGVVEGPSVDLIETLAERIASELLALDSRIAEVTVRVRKPAVKLGVALDHAAVEIARRRLA